MARYDYRCTACDKVFEVEHGMREHPEVTCPDCGAAATRVLSASGIVFKGSGFYNTDERGKKGSSAATADKPTAPRPARRLRRPRPPTSPRPRPRLRRPTSQSAEMSGAAPGPAPADAPPPGAPSPICQLPEIALKQIALYNP